MSTESDESVLEEGFMENARCVDCEEEFFKINLDVDLTGRLVDVVDHCRQLPLHLYLPVQWLKNV